MNIKEAKELIKIVFRTQIETGVRIAVELESGPGMGKSESVRQVTQELEKDMGEAVGEKVPVAGS